MAAMGALSTLACRPAPRRAGERRGESHTAQSVAAWLSALSLAGLGRAVGPCPVWERDATDAARSWLRLVDEGRHAASWRAGAPLLREAVEAGEWERALDAVRGPLGPCRWRALRWRSVVESPSEDLRGSFVVTRFDGVFERGRAIETVTSTLGADGHWRVAAYYVR